MRGFLDTAGERLSIECALPWVTELLAEGAGGEFVGSESPGASVRVRVEAEQRRFDTRRWELLTRGAWRRNGEVVLENACTAGFDLHLRCEPAQAEFTYRWRPPARYRTANWALRSRFHLLARAVLMQYPALWWAGTRGRAPLHASACGAGEWTPLLSAPSGIGRSTLLLGELRAGGRATGDNLAVGDGASLWGLVEPLRVEGGSGRRMPHGRHEALMSNRVEKLVPDSLVVLKRVRPGEPSLSICSAETAARSLVTSTYMAGELRRYWPFAATLSAGTGSGAPHPPITEVATEFSENLPSFVLAAGRPGAGLRELLESVEVRT